MPHLYTNRSGLILHHPSPPFFQRFLERGSSSSSSSSSSPARSTLNPARAVSKEEAKTNFSASGVVQLLSFGLCGCPCVEC
mmetsp:Transcript_7725/g.15946  ORF Transcript_7725/g.15946 Transcript_7725/m.15946 type:complete len:81 (-) Transcript_7725:229-471(-)